MIDAATIEEFEVRLPDPAPLTKVERERRAFDRLLPELLRTHRGQYVAIHDERVVDSGTVRLELALRVQASVRDDIYVGLITDVPHPAARSGIRRVIRVGKVGA